MPQVKILEKSVAERIAAGEVIERPASVVKELVENALDAGASRIAVEIFRGGQEIIRVTDDGSGMSTEDAVLALKRFATSKITAWEDMDRLSSFGFRGEALPSIAAVSHFTLYTRERGAPAGSRLTLQGGELEEVAPYGGAQGTIIEVRDIFFNTPARRKFLKSVSAETSFIIELLQKFALANPGVDFMLHAQGKKLLHLPAALDTGQKLQQIWGMPAAEFISLDAALGTLKLKGFIAPPEFTRRSRSAQFFFVNRRMVRSPLLSQALQEGYGPLLQSQHFPLACLSLELPPAELDVNVHPAKLEIKFASSSAIFKALQQTVHAALTPEPMTMTPDAKPSGAMPGWVRETGTARQTQLWPSEAAQLAPPGLLSTALWLKESAQDYGKFYPLAQIAQTFIAGLYRGELWLIDQHAAHERLNYNRLQHIESQARQNLALPEILELTAAQAHFLSHNLEAFTALGWELEPMGEHSFALRSLPPGMERLACATVILELLEELRQEERSGITDFKEKLRRSMACHSSVQAGESLNTLEMQKLFEAIIQAEDGAYCPHGRPAYLKWGEPELRKLFKRS